MMAEVPSDEERLAGPRIDLEYFCADFMKEFGCTQGEFLQFMSNRMYKHGHKEGYEEGYRKGYTAGRNKAKGRKPKNPGKRGVPSKINSSYANLLYGVVDEREQGVTVKDAVVSFHKAMLKGSIACEARRILSETQSDVPEEEAEDTLKATQQGRRKLYEMKKAIQAKLPKHREAEYRYYRMKSAKKKKKADL